MKAVAALAFLVLIAASEPIRAQTADEVDVLRRAAALEARGRNEEAVALLGGLLEKRPASSGALFSLERVLRPLGRVEAVLPFADRFLEAEPRTPGVRYLKLRVLSEIDSVAGLQPAIEAWIDAEPRSPEPWREGARVLEERVGVQPALELLRRGREALDGSDLLAIETGDLLLRSGDTRGAVEEWARALGPDGSDAQLILRRLERLGDAAEVAEALVVRLAADPTTTARRRVGVRIAVATGLSAPAVELAEKVASSLEGNARKDFLAELAGDAEQADLSAVALWAWDRMRRETAGNRERRVLNQRIASTALAVGDTATALEASIRLARSLPPGSAERRRVIADLIRVEATAGEPDLLQRRLEGFRAEFPDAPELDELASAVAAGLRAKGRGEDAAAVLDGVRGPRSAVERAYLLFEEGAVEEGKEALLAAVGGLDPARATGTIQLAALLDRLSPPAAALVARSAALAHRARPEAALTAVEEGLPGVPGDERAAVLAHAARLAEEWGDADGAAALRGRLVAEHPEAPEAPEAGLALARWHARSPEGVEEAVRILEELILAQPGSAVVPAARRELERLRSGEPEP
ncbi:MAG: hypothetical protein PVI57_05045 [Gemmatimonadota bacterium]|jgi:tetratricopeptide (TPR) repeat protein